MHSRGSRGLCSYALLSPVFWPRDVEMKFTVAGSERQRVTRRSLHQIYSSLGRRGRGWTSHPKNKSRNNRRESRSILYLRFWTKVKVNGGDDDGYMWRGKDFCHPIFWRGWMRSRLILNELDGIWNLEREEFWIVVRGEHCLGYCAFNIMVWENWRKDFNIVFNVKSTELHLLRWNFRILLETILKIWSISFFQVQHQSKS